MWNRQDGEKPSIPYPMKLLIACVITGVSVFAAVIHYDARRVTPADVEKLRLYTIYDRNWLAFYRAYIGCPNEDLLPETVCDASRGVIDYKSYTAARRDAMKIFDLEERR